MIVVDKVSKKILGDKIRISCSFFKNEKQEMLWFETSLENDKYIITDNCDAFFIILFLVAFYEQKNLILKAPVSGRLLYGINNYLMDILILINGEKYQKINVTTEIDRNRYVEPTGVATAMSLGVDSFYTLIKNREGYNAITHLTLFNAGAFGQNGGEEARSLFVSMRTQVQAVANELNLPLLWVDTNLNEILNASFLKTHTFRNLACALLFQNLIRTYLYSSTLTIKDFKLNASTTANYDPLNSMAISGNYLQVLISGLMTSRFEKTREIAAYSNALQHLNVCLVTSDYNDIRKEEKFLNCSKCFKCVRTMVSLDVLGKLDEFSAIFDLDIYKNNKEKYLAEILYHYIRSKNSYSREILEGIKQHNFKIPKKTYYYLVLRMFKPIIERFK